MHTPDVSMTSLVFWVLKAMKDRKVMKLGSTCVMQTSCSNHRCLGFPLSRSLIAKSSMIGCGPTKSGAGFVDRRNPRSRFKFWTLWPAIATQRSEPQRNASQQFCINVSGQDHFWGQTGLSRTDLSWLSKLAAKIDRQRKLYHSYWW